MASNQEIDQFVAITQGSKQDAERFLTSGTDLQSAIENYYAAQGAEGVEADPSESDSLMPDPEAPTTVPVAGGPPVPIGGPRTLDGRVAEAMPEGWGKPQPKAKAAPKSGGIATLFNTGIHPSASGGGDDSDDEDERQELYAGGAKSGLAVHDPNQKKKGPRGIVDDILSQAAKNTPHDDPESSGASGSKSSFRGSGNVLGSEDAPSASDAPGGASGSSAPSVAAVTPSAFDALLGSMFGRAPPPPAEEEETQVRHLTFWRNGFSIEDGPLMSYDDPANKELLEAIHSGRAPPSLFGVRYNQPLQVMVDQKTNEDYVKPKPVAKAFGGSGNRLGSPAPEAAGSGASTPARMPGGFGQAASGTSSGSAPSASQSGPSGASFELDDSKPSTSIQVRLGDGTKMVAKVNLTHTVGDLRNFVSAARPDSRSFVLQTTFPSKELKDDSETIEAAKLQNAVVVQRFT